MINDLLFAFTSKYEELLSVVFQFCWKIYVYKDILNVNTLYLLNNKHRYSEYSGTNSIQTTVITTLPSSYSLLF